MKPQYIRALIDKYYQGMSTPEEEAFLKNSVENNSEEEYNAVRSQLQVMSSIYEEGNKLDKSFDEKILHEISKAKAGKSRLFNIQRVLTGVAATILLLISIWFVNNMLSSQEVYGTINNPQAAFAETKKIIQKVSGNVNKGIKPATSTIKKAESGLDKTKKVKQIKKLNSTSELLKSMTKVTVDLRKS